MIQKMHGIDRHKRSVTISVMDRSGTEMKFLQSCNNMDKYIETLAPADAIIFETGLGSFYWADKIEKTGGKGDIPPKKIDINRRYERTGTCCWANRPK